MKSVCTSAWRRSPRAPAPVHVHQRRHRLDLSIHGGRSSVSGIVATVFGATGFVGRYVVNQLGRIGSQVVVPWRLEPKSYTHLKVMGDLGQIVPHEWALRDMDSIRAACRYSNVVINLVGQHYDTRNFTMAEVHIDGAARIAQAAKEAGVDRFIHVSALAAGSDAAVASSDWARTKREGERAVRAAYPDAIILRPAPLWGAQDNFLHHRASMARFWPVYPIVHPDRKLAPLFVNDLATAALAAIKNPDALGKTFELAGRDTVTERQLSDWVAKVLKLHPRTVEITDDSEAGSTILWNLGYWLSQHRKPRYTLDGLSLKADLVPTGQLPSFAALGVPPETTQPLFSQLSLSYILAYRKPVRQLEVYLDDEPEEIKQLQQQQPLRPLF